MGLTSINNELPRLSDGQLLTIQRRAHAELWKRRVTNWNLPHAQWAEDLAAEGLGLDKAPANSRGYDLVKGKNRYQVKSSAADRAGNFSPLRSDDYTHVIAVRLTPDTLLLDWAREINAADVEGLLVWRAWVRGNTLAVAKVKDLGRDVTPKLRRAQDKLFHRKSAATRILR